MQGEAGNGFALPIRRQDYLRLVDHSGREIRHGKRGRVDPGLRPILERLEPSGNWMAELIRLSRRYCRAIGSIASLTEYREALGQQRLRGLSS